MEHRGRAQGPDGDAPDALARAAQALAALPGSDRAREAVATVLEVVRVAFTETRSVRDALPRTAPDSVPEALAMVAGISQLSSALSALEAQWQDRAARRMREEDASHGVHGSRQGAGAAQELGVARRVSPAASSFSLAASQRLVGSMPHVMAALQDGRCTQQQARAICRGVARLTAEECRRVDEEVHRALPRLDGMGERRITAFVDELITELLPEGAEARADRAARERHVSSTRRSDGMACLNAHLRAADAAAVMTALRIEAESRRAAGSKHPVGALQADVLVEAVLGHVASLGTGAGSHRLDVGVVITDRALLDREDTTSSALLEGYGTIPAHIIRDTLCGRPPGHLAADPDAVLDQQADAVLRRLYTHPASGELVAMDSTARRFPGGMARLIRRRDTTCRMPWCNAQIRHIDHISAHAKGGRTAPGNGQGLCARCNLLREQGYWQLDPVDGTILPGPEARSTAPPSPAGPAPPGDPAIATQEPPAHLAPDPRLGRERPGSLIRWRTPHGAVGSSSTPRLRRPAAPSGAADAPTAGGPAPLLEERPGRDRDRAGPTGDAAAGSGIEPPGGADPPAGTAGDGSGR